jgi:signal transduction histidine kinase
MLEVQDDGVGFETVRGGQAPLSGTGILGMRERVARLHGEFQLNSKRGAGTSIRVTLPAPLPDLTERTEEEVRG